MGALSRNNGSADPVVIYVGGDLGCSSLNKLAVENGPFVFDNHESRFVANPTAWNNRANVFWVETLASQGFSICPRNETNVNDTQCAFNDLNATADLTAAIIGLMTRKFPELLRRDVYLAGDNYAGVILPQLALALNTTQVASKTKTPFFVRGLFIENGKTDRRQFDGSYDLDVAYFNG